MQMLRWLQACEMKPLLRPSLNIHIHIYLISIQLNLIFCSTHGWRYSPAHPQLLLMVIYTTPLLLSVVLLLSNLNAAPILTCTQAPDRIPSAGAAQNKHLLVLSINSGLISSLLRAQT